MNELIGALVYRIGKEKNPNFGEIKIKHPKII